MRMILATSAPQAGVRVDFRLIRHNALVPEYKQPLINLQLDGSVNASEVTMHKLSRRYDKSSPLRHPQCLHHCRKR